MGGSHERSTPKEPRSVSERSVGSSGSQRSKTSWGAAQSSPITSARLAMEATLVAGQAEAFRREPGELPGGEAGSASLPHRVDQLEVEPVPPASARPVEPLRMPEDREGAAELRRPVEKLEHPRPRLRGREPFVALLGEGRVHHGERHLDEVGRTFAREVPRPERVRDAGPEAERVRKAERGVVAEADPGERREVPVRVDAEVVVALPEQRAVELREQRPLPREPVEVVGGEIAAVDRKSTRLN